jgi:hypothetical protein
MPAENRRAGFSPFPVEKGKWLRHTLTICYSIPSWGDSGRHAGQVVINLKKKTSKALEIIRIVIIF